DRERIHYIAQKKAVESVDIKELSSEELCQQSLLSEGINHRKSISDRREQHRKDRRLADQPFIPFSYICVVDRICQDKGQDSREKRTAYGDCKAVPQSAQEASSGQHLDVVGKRCCFSVSGEGFHQDTDHGHCQKSCEKHCHHRKNSFNLSVLSHNAHLFSRPVPVVQADPQTG